MNEINRQVRMKLANPTPIGFHLYASLFFDAAKAVEQEPLSPVYNFLLGRSIELGLKAFLLSRGDDVDTLRKKKFGHNLKALLDRACRHDFNTIVGPRLAEITAINALNKYYDDKIFEYFRLPKRLNSYPELPRAEILREFATRMLKRVRVECVRAIKKH